ncbi:MAG: Rrf2 family transcriptional regulator [Myxococcales bacterium]|nr:Rrf2 family transcriptional regulator [Myxococcales bacterium]
MKLSNKSRYAIQAVFDLAFHAEGSASQVKEISERQRIPPRFLEQVFQDLRRAGLVRSKRGPKGGYQLAHRAADIRLGDVVRAVDGPVALAQPEPDAAALNTTSVQVSQAVLSEVAGQIEACMDAVSLSDMCDKARRLGLRAHPAAPYVYSI